MKFRETLVILIFLIALTGLAEDTLFFPDTLPKPPLNPTLDITQKSIDYSGVNIAWAGSFYPRVIFFESESSELDPSYRRILRYFADCLVQNPDVHCEIRGYYSPSIDNIDSPAVGRELATKRAMAVREVLLLRHPQMGLKVSATLDGYDYAQAYFDSAGQYDSRVELIPTVSDWSPRVVVSSAELPYWRRGFRNIAENDGKKLAEILTRNPDLNLLFASGLLDVPAVEAYNRIETVVAKFRKEMNWKDDSRLVAVHGGNAKKGEMIIDLQLGFCGPQPNNRGLLWVQPEDYRAPKINIALGADIPSETRAYRIISRFGGRQFPVARGNGEYPGRLEIDPLDTNFILLPGDIDFSMMLWRNSLNVEQSPWRTLKINKSAGYYELGIIPMINFAIDKVEPFGHWETAMEPVVRRIDFLSKAGGELRLSIVGHAADFEHGTDTLAIARAQFLWKRLSDRLIVLFGAKDLEDLGKRFAKTNVTVELSQELHAFRSGRYGNLPCNTGPLADLPKEHLGPWVPFATVKLEYRDE